MAKQKTAYELSQSQVQTPDKVVSLFWRLTRERRKNLAHVLDMGAGDGRFARGGHFKRYTGVEIDRNRMNGKGIPNGQLIHGCVFRHEGEDYDACIGNPPYARHHDLEDRWRDRVVGRIEKEMSVTLNRHCNLYIYFFCLALMKSRPNGLVAMVIPYEWVSRPSARPLREYIKKQRWHVSVYRFREPIFDGVTTTASITIVEKDKSDAKWEFFDLDVNGFIEKRRGMARGSVLEYAERGEIWALRGLSPGSQKIFTLTEGERVRTGLSRNDVMPCVTSLREVPTTVQMLTEATFRKYFVQAGQRCWLIRSNAKHRSAAMEAYLHAVPEKLRATSTCENQVPWFNYKGHPVPQMLFSSGFTTFGPKILVNAVKAHAVGSVWGIHARRRIRTRSLQKFLRAINFERQVVAHARKLKKVEVRQLNGVLTSFTKKEDAFA